MQNSVLKFLSILFLVTLTLISAASGQSASSDLTRADSLFQQKRYIQSFEIYQTIFQEQHYTPAMLLKMAYIQEGLNQPAQSIYYLNLYYLATQDEAAVVKMNEMADKYRLEGYESSEVDVLWTVYHKHHENITYSIFTLVALLIIFILTQKFRSKKPIVAWIFLFLISCSLLADINFGSGRSNGIISKNNTYLMNGPSGGASVVSIVRDGHKVKIKGKEDVWVKVLWGDREVYVKETSVLPLTL